MYLIVDKTTQTILHMSNSFAGQEKAPEELLPGFDPATMAFGRSPEQFIPAEFVIEDGVVKDQAPPEVASPESLDEAKSRRLQKFSRSALNLRQQLIADHQMLNAGIGVYDEERVKAIRTTVQAFRDEYHRLENAVSVATSVQELEAIQPRFPQGLVTGLGGATRK